MLKLRKVYICDCCGRLEKAIATKYKFGIPYKYKEPFLLGKHFRKTTMSRLCSYIPRYKRYV